MLHVGLGGRVEIDPNWTEKEVAELADSSSIEIIQYSEYNVPSRELLRGLNEQIFARRSDVTFRIYGFHLQEADLSVLQEMPDVERLIVDCCTRIAEPSDLGGLAKLRELELDVFELDSFELLHEVRSDLSLLRLGKTRSKKPDLSVIQRFSSLEKLALNGQRKNIEVVQKLQRLKQVYIHGISLGDLAFLERLPQLTLLHIGFGSAEKLDWLAGLVHLQELKLLRVKGLKDLSALSALSQLQQLQIVDQPLVEKLPSLAGLPRLKRIICDNVGLVELDGALDAPALDEWVLLDMPTLTTDDAARLIDKRRPSRLTVSLKKAAANKELQAMLEQEGFSEQRGWWL
ncbi:hypothetical protein B9G55_10495 [Saccharibacillus sp. O16]|nr:hypothetical protein B9G55_10495 [Saccharibacillus sp. O16]